MSCPMPEIGSCISLISKADIRYEGLLFTVDPDRCTIALARVKSYGTEDRETQFPIAPQNQCYDYILFRGSDIKDIRVINNNPVPNDPAIMQMHLPPQQQLPPMQNKLGQPGFQPQPGFMMPQMGPGPMSGPPPGHQPLGQPYSSFGGINNLGDLIGAGANTSGSRSTTPSNLLARKSPTVDMGVQTNQQQQQQTQSGSQQTNNRDTNRSGGDGGNMDRTNNQRNRNNNQRNNNMQRERRDSTKNDGGQMKDGFNKNMQRQGNQNNQNRGWNNRGNNQNQSNNMRGRPRGRGGIPQGLNRAKNLLKFENDYDFEQANNKFEELRSQLSKLKVGDEVKPEQLNSDTIDKKDDSGNETGAGEHEQEEDEVVCYDKAKSFFDTISCEAIERAKGKQQRTDWRQERKLNTETFGVGSTRRGGYNRRGGYYNRGPNHYRGNNQYRNNYRGRSGNRNNQPNGLPHNNGGSRNTGNSNSNNQQTQPQQPQQPRLQSPQAQQPAAIEVGAGK
ncbi:uncharacterized protein LOC128734310 isoform X2 [Sabethes cyaneus]|uniref:uncharacterized protein LOC128734310 isoform X2 n=1 Tax=Sabethes cyaneus TaxID=53552 RepID=UPI00237E8E3F|nr:uncharacterized protein LOC128734310 isoform X2 [Sabethes cyaneus]